MTTNPIEELIEKKLISKKKLETQIEDAKDYVRRATNKLEEKTESLEKREDELASLEVIRLDVVKVIARKQKIDDIFIKEYVAHVSIDEYNRLVKEDHARRDFNRTPPSQELIPLMTEYYTLQPIIEEHYAKARKVYYNR